MHKNACLGNYKVYDSTGSLVRGGFSSYQAALEYKLTYGNSGWTIK